MIYQYTSIREIIARVVMNMNLADNSLVGFLPEWIGQACESMQVQQYLRPKFCTITVRDHYAKLPKSLQILEAVSYENCRLQETGDVRDFTSRPYQERNDPGGTAFITTVINNQEIGDLEERTPQSDHMVTLTQINQLPTSYNEYYKKHPGYLELSFRSGTITIFYWALPTDDKGYALIPANEDFKQALYWYCRMMIIGTGYKDPVFSYGDVKALWDVASDKAVADASFPDSDRLYKVYLNSTSLIFPSNWYSDFDMSVQGGRRR